MKRVGIIGGMGPLATIDLYEKIVKLADAKCDQDNIPLVIDNNTIIPDRPSYILDHTKPNPLPGLIQSANRLKNAGCEAICLACNTAHYFVDDIIKQTGVKVLDMPKITVNSILKDAKNVKNICVLATNVTISTGIYEKELNQNGLNSVKLSNQIQEKLMSCIYDGVKAGKVAKYTNIFEEIVNSLEADLFLAACTELPIFLPLIKTDKKFMDPTLELAKEIIKFSRG